MDIPKFYPNDTVITKKPHPCSSQSFTVLRAGSDVRIKCDGCGREMTVDRIKFEKMIKKIIRSETQNTKNVTEKGTAL